MRDLLIFTQKELAKSNLACLLEEEFPELKTLDDSDNHYYKKTNTTGLEVYYLKNEKASDDDSFMEEYLDNLPNRDAFLCHIAYTETKIALRIVRKVKENFENVFVEDSDFDWFGSADEFLTCGYNQKCEDEIREHSKKLTKGLY